MIGKTLLLVLLTFGSTFAEAKSVKLKITDPKGKILRREFSLKFETEVLKDVVPGHACAISPVSSPLTNDEGGARIACSPKGNDTSEMPFVEIMTLCSLQLTNWKFMRVGTIKNEKPNVSLIEISCNDSNDW